MQNNGQICYLVITLKLFPNFILKYFKPLKFSESYVQFNKQQYVLLPNLYIYIYDITLKTYIDIVWVKDSLQLLNCSGGDSTPEKVYHHWLHPCGH